MSGGNDNNGNGNTKLLIGIIVLLIGSHYGTMAYRVNKLEDEQVTIRKEFAAAALSAAVAAAQALAVAAAAAAAAAGAHK